MEIIYVILIALAALDGFIMRRLNPQAFARVFGKARWFWPLLLLLGFICSTSIDFLLENFASVPWPWGIVGFVVLLALYSYRRCEWRHSCGDASLNASAIPSPGKLEVLIGALDVLFQWTLWVSIYSLGIHVLSPTLFKESSKLLEVLLTAGFSTIFFVALIKQQIHREHDHWRDRLAFKIQPGLTARTIVAPILLGLVMAVLSSTLLLTRAHQPQTPLGEILKNSNSAVGIVFFLVLAVLLAPLCEEIIFRGYFFDVLRRVKGVKFSFLLVGLSFGLLHVGQYWGDWLAIGMVMALGFLLTGVRVWSSSTWASTILHYVYNGWVTVLPILYLVFANPSFLKYETMGAELTFAQKEVLLKKSLQTQPRFKIASYELLDLYQEDDAHLEEGLALIEQILSQTSSKKAVVSDLEIQRNFLIRLGRDREARLVEEKIRARDPSWKEKKRSLNLPL